MNYCKFLLLLSPSSSSFVLPIHYIGIQSKAVNNYATAPCSRRIISMRCNILYIIQVAGRIPISYLLGFPGRRPKQVKRCGSYIGSATEKKNHHYIRWHCRQIVYIGSVYVEVYKCIIHLLYISTGKYHYVLPTYLYVL